MVAEQITVALLFGGSLNSNNRTNANKSIIIVPMLHAKKGTMRTKYLGGELPIGDGVVSQTRNNKMWLAVDTSIAIHFW